MADTEAEPDPSKLPTRPRTLAGEYLDEAAEALHAAGNPDRLFRSGRNPDTPEKAKMIMRALAARQRERHCRNGILFAALSAEAYINEFLEATLEGADANAVGRMSPVDRYVLGLRIARPNEPAWLWRDDEVMPTIAELFALRNKLVHARPGYAPKVGYSNPGKYEKDAFGPEKLAMGVVAVAGAARLLVRLAYGPDEMDFPASLYWPARERILSYAERAQTLPDWNASPEPPLFEQALEHVRSLPGAASPS